MTPIMPMFARQSTSTMRSTRVRSFSLSQTSTALLTVISDHGQVIQDKHHQVQGGPGEVQVNVDVVFLVKVELNLFVLGVSCNIVIYFHLSRCHDQCSARYDRR